jgi:hypothetical protein
MTREELEQILIECRRINDRINSMPHVDALLVISSLSTIRAIVGEQLPGGEIQHCEACGGLYGIDEVIMGEEIWVCNDCIEGAQQAAQ